MSSQSAPAIGSVANSLHWREPWASEDERWESIQQVLLRKPGFTASKWDCVVWVTVLFFLLPFCVLYCLCSGIQTYKRRIYKGSNRTRDQPLGLLLFLQQHF